MLRVDAEHAVRAIELCDNHQCADVLLDAGRNCISNVRPEGMSYAAAAFKLAWLVREALNRGLTGVDLKDESDLALLTGGNTARLPGPIA